MANPSGFNWNVSFRYLISVHLAQEDYSTSLQAFKHPRVILVVSQDSPSGSEIRVVEICSWSQFIE